MIQIIVCTRSPMIDADRNAECHRHDFWQIDWVISGKYGIHVHSNELTLRPREILIIPPGVMHRVTRTRSVKLFVLKCKPQADFPFLKPFVVRRVDADFKILLEEIFKSHHCAHRFGQAIAQKYAEILFYRYIVDPLTQTDEKMEMAQSLIKERCEKVFSLHWVADRVGLHQNYFIKRFKKIHGLTPGGYHRQCRFEKAKMKLLTGTQSITEIATSLGYGSLYEFSNAFKKMSGYSPSEYRLQAHNG